MRLWYISVRHYLIKRHLKTTVLNYIISNTRALCNSIFLSYVDVLPPPSLSSHENGITLLKFRITLLKKKLGSRKGDRDQEKKNCGNWRRKNVSILSLVKSHLTPTELVASLPESDLFPQPAERSRAAVTSVDMGLLW